MANDCFLASAFRVLPIELVQHPRRGLFEASFWLINTHVGYGRFIASSHHLKRGQFQLEVEGASGWDYPIFRRRILSGRTTRIKGRSGSLNRMVWLLHRFARGVFEIIE